MAERGGKRTPPARTGPSGPGRFSKRDERVQPIREPDIDQLELEYGDRQRLTEAQRIARLPQGGAAQGRPSTEMFPTGEPRTQGGLPPWLMDMPSAFPDEPVSSGLAMGPGSGPEALELSQPPEDVRELTLSYLANVFGNPEAQQILAQLREERARTMAPPQMGPPPGQGEAQVPEGQPVEEVIG